MSKQNCFSITVFPGDGIGHEITPICLELLNLTAKIVGNFKLEFSSFSAGAQHYKETGVSLSAESLEHAFNSDATLLACMGMPSIRYPDGREIAPQLELREKMDLFAGVRPVKTMQGLPLPLRDERAKNLDFILIRESTEGLFSSREHFKIEGEGSEAVASDIQRISHKGCERLFNFAFELARQRKDKGYQGRLTCVDKANVLGSFYFMRQVFDAVAKNNTDVNADHVYVDAAALQLVSKPWTFDVMVTENMFGDILSDLGAGLMGGMGMAPSADIGENNAVFQPCHGSAPDIIGQGKANPTAMFLSAALMLDWLGHRFDSTAAVQGARHINKAVENAYASGELLPYELGGYSGTEVISAKVMSELQKL